MKYSSQNLKNSWKLIVLSLMATFVLSSCGDDDSGPTRTDLLVGTWEIDEINGVSASSSLIWEVTFEADGEFEEIENFTFAETVRFTGDWEWNAAQTEITLDYDGGGEVDLEVKSLTNEEIEVEVEGDDYLFTKD